MRKFFDIFFKKRKNYLLKKFFIDFLRRIQKTNNFNRIQEIKLRKVYYNKIWKIIRGLIRVY